MRQLNHIAGSDSHSSRHLLVNWTHLSIEHLLRFSWKRLILAQTSSSLPNCFVLVWSCLSFIRSLCVFSFRSLVFSHCFQHLPLKPCAMVRQERWLTQPVARSRFVGIFPPYHPGLVTPNWSKTNRGLLKVGEFFCAKTPSWGKNRWLNLVKHKRSICQNHRKTLFWIVGHLIFWGIFGGLLCCGLWSVILFSSFLLKVCYRRCSVFDAIPRKQKPHRSSSSMTSRVKDPNIQTNPTLPKEKTMRFRPWDGNTGTGKQFFPTDPTRMQKEKHNP